MVVVTLLACCWAAVTAAAVLARVPPASARARARAISGALPRRRAAADVPFRRSVVGRVVHDVLRRRRARQQRRQLTEQLPVALDLLTVAAGAGWPPAGATAVAAGWSPPAIAAALTGALRATRLGAAFDDAITDTGRHQPVLVPLADALATAARLGTPLRPALERLAADARADVRRAAEARARTVPVRLLFPLVFLVLPAFGLITLVPAIHAGLRGG